jgi:hypothetical protein
LSSSRAHCLILHFSLSLSLSLFLLPLLDHSLR